MATLGLLTCWSAMATAFDGPPSCRCLTNASINLVEPLDAVANDSASSTFGLSCRAHDASTSACQPVVPAAGSLCDNVQPVPSSCLPRAIPDWCAHEWCYVDRAACSIDSHVSLLPARHDSPRFYSYAACGYADTYAGPAVRDMLRGSVLRVAFRQNSAGYIGAYHPQAGHEHRDGDWFGPFVDVIQAAAERAGFILNITEIPSLVRDLGRRQTNSSSAFTECVYATGLGYVDLCIGSFAVTAEREALSSFLTLWIEDTFLVISAEQTPVAFSAATAVKIFEPFSWQLWLWIFSAVLALSAVLAFQERGWPNGDFEDLGSAAWARGDGLATALGRTYYLGLKGLLNGGIEHASVSPGGRVTQLGLTWMFVLVAAFYTANLTTILVTNQQAFAVSSLADAINSGYTLCATRSHVPALRNRHPGILLATDPEDGVVGLRSRAHLADGIDAAKCQGAVMAEEDLRMARSRGQHCNKVIVGGSVNQVARGVPLFNRHATVPALRYYLQQLVDNGDFHTMVEAHEPTPTCAAISSPDSDSLSLQTRDLLGTFALAGIFALAGVAVSVCCGSRKGVVGRAIGKMATPLEQLAAARLKSFCERSFEEAQQPAAPPIVKSAAATET